MEREELRECYFVIYFVIYLSVYRTILNYLELATKKILFDDIRSKINLKFNTKYNWCFVNYCFIAIHESTLNSIAVERFEKVRFPISYLYKLFV